MNNLKKMLRDFLKPEMEGKPFTPEFIGYLKGGVKVVLRNAVIFTVVVQIVLYAVDPAILNSNTVEEHWLAVILYSLLIGGAMSPYFLSPNKAVRVVGVLMNAALLYGLLFPPTGPPPEGVEIVLIFVFWYGGLGVAIYVLLQYAKLLFEELGKSGHWEKKNKNTLV